MTKKEQLNFGIFCAKRVNHITNILLTKKLINDTALYRDNKLTEKQLIQSQNDTTLEYQAYEAPFCQEADDASCPPEASDDAYYSALFASECDPYNASCYAAKACCGAEWELGLLTEKSAWAGYLAYDREIAEHLVELRKMFEEK